MFIFIMLAILLDSASYVTGKGGTFHFDDN